ncbi:hypothetical protein [Martelella mediterranea]|uniref:Uncharacterized protein n=1 Tax=Martelella mediterranea TaxID=293089 RepID=A0A4R3NTK4_9HYPH|nr:hypothetical protein [Martelella mediterranea]TCT41120.1 hypothetical protein EDC90_100796 [Martelella mediterranea]
MDRLISLAATVLSVDSRLLARSAKRNMIIAVVLIFLFFSAYAGGVAALAIYLASVLGPLGAALTVAIASLALAIFVLAYALIMNRMEQRRMKAARLATEEMLQGVAGIVPAMMREKPISGLAAAAGLAYVLARTMAKKK